MDLFEQASGRLSNLLPEGGEVYYHGSILDKSKSDLYFQKLYADIPWQNDQMNYHGKEVITKRKIAWFGDIAFNYTYSNTTKTALSWTPILQELRDLVQKETQEKFNSCLLNLYHSGEEGMTWHSDAERELVKGGAIASLTFGAVRKFSFKHKRNKKSVSKMLEHGSLLVMRGETQQNWLHSIPKTTLILSPRINLTFRQMRLP